jgi:hypothetical protein
MTWYHSSNNEYANGATAEERYTQIRMERPNTWRCLVTAGLLTEARKNNRTARITKSRISFPVLRTPLAAVLPYPVEDLVWTRVSSPTMD